MFPNREGLFHAYPAAIGLGETRENKLLQAVIQYRLIEELIDGTWTDCSGENLEITGYHILEKRDRTLNENTIESLKAALGWDGRDPFWLQDNIEALAVLPVQVKLATSEYNGQQNLKVAFLNPYGAKGGNGGVRQADDDLRRNIANRLGAKFRALAGGTPANPPKPAGKPTMPANTATATASPTTASVAPAPSQPAAPRPTASKPAAPPPQASAPPAFAPAVPTATMDQAWIEFSNHCSPDQWNQEDTEKEWFRVLSILFPGKQPNQLTPADWGIMLTQGPSKIIPF